MVLSSDRERIKTLLVETITLLCKNGLNFQFEFSVEALIGITIDQSDVFLINIQETVKSGQGNERDKRGQGEMQNDSSTEQFSDASLPASIRNVDYQQNAISLQLLSQGNAVKDVLSTEGNEDGYGRLLAVSGSGRKTKTNPVGKNYHEALSPSKTDGCLPEIPLASPSAADDVCDLENVFPNVPLQKNSEVSDEGLTFTNQELPRKRRRGVSPLSRRAGDEHRSHETNIEDLITQCKSEPLDVIKLEESPIGSAVESPNRHENSSFLYNSTYSNDVSLRLDPSYANWYGQDVVNSSAVPGCSTWPNNSTQNTSTKHLPDQGLGWIESSLPMLETQKKGQAVDHDRSLAVDWSTPGSVEKFPYKCTLCDKQMKLLRDLRAHMTAKHNLEKGFECHVCGSMSTYKHNLLRHLRTVHGIKQDQLSTTV